MTKAYQHFRPADPDALQAAKALVRRYQTDLDAAAPDRVADVLGVYLTDDALWRGMHPFHEQTGPKSVAEAFWTPMTNAFSRLHRREDIFFAGANTLDDDGKLWVTSMGHFMGLFDAPFLGIQPTDRIAMIRYAEFSCVEGDRITEQALFIDILHIMAQAGQYPLPDMTGAMMIQPGPQTHDGILLTPQDNDEGALTLDRINTMIAAIDHANKAAVPLHPRDELKADWHDDMIWWGPAGIGATYTIDRYIDQHQAPFRRQMSGRQFNGHLARFAEGAYGGFFGWPNLTMAITGNFLGMPATGKTADLRVVDIYRRDGDKLAENWIFIDFLHFLNQQGRDILAELQAPHRAAAGRPAE